MKKGPKGPRIPADKLSQHFWSNVDIGGLDDCWEWKLARNRRGYGSFTTTLVRTRAHRYAYQDTYGAIPPGLCVRHACDNPPCCNPKHLKLGTHLDNIQDMNSRGRHAKKGSYVWLSRKEHNVLIRLHEMGVSRDKLMDIFSIGASSLTRRIRAGILPEDCHKYRFKVERGSGK